MRYIPIWWLLNGLFIETKEFQQREVLHERIANSFCNFCQTKFKTM